MLRGGEVRRSEGVSGANVRWLMCLQRLEIEMVGVKDESVLRVSETGCRVV